MLGSIKRVKEKYNKIPLPVKAGMFFLICTVLQNGLNIISLPIFTRLLSKEQYGLSSMYFAWNDLFAIVCTFRFSYGVFDKGMIKYKEEKDVFESSLLGLSMTITGISFCVFLVFRDVIADWLNLSFGLCVSMFCYQLFAPALMFWTNRSKFDYNYKAYSAVTICASVGITLINILSVLYLDGDKGINKILSYQSMWILVNIIVAICIFNKGRIFFRRDIWKYALQYNIPLLPYFFSTVVLDKMDRVMITDICGKSDVALYSVSYSLANLMILFTSAIGGTFTPWIYNKLSTKDYKDISKITNIILVTFMGISFAFMLFAPEVIKLFASEDYYEAIYVIPPVVASNFFILVYSLVSKIEYYYEKTKMVALISIITALCNVILNYLFIPKFGYIAAAYTTLISYFISTVMHYFISDRIIKKNGIKDEVYSKVSIVILSVITLLVTVSIELIYKSDMIRWSLIISCIVCFVVLKNIIVEIFILFKVRK